MFENVRGILDAVIEDFRTKFASAEQLKGYKTDWKLLNACDFGVSQLRPRVVFVAIKEEFASDGSAINGTAGRQEAEDPVPTVGEKIFDLISERGWPGAKKWKQQANEIAPTIVGGSCETRRPNLGPTRARREWAALGVDGLGIADAAPDRDYVGMPRLTVRMVARLQGFPDTWEFKGGKTAAYRQVGNAFPPPVAEAVARQIRACLTAETQSTGKRKAV